LIIDRTFRRNAVAISYVTNFETIDLQKPLLVIFPAVNSSPGFCLASYFAFNGNQEFNVIHIIDNYGAHGSYFLTRMASEDMMDVLIDLLRRYVAPIQGSGRDIIFAGTSKGASIALMAAGHFDNVHCVAGEPQIKLGEFLLDKDGFKNEASRSIAYSIRGTVSVDDREFFNTLILDRITANLPTWSSPVTVLAGATSGYLYWHIEHLMNEVEKHPGALPYFQLRIGQYSSHNDVIDAFISAMQEIGITYRK